MLQILQQEREGGCVVSLRGEAGVAESQALTEVIIQLAAQRPPVLVFDISGLTFISSLAMGEFASLAGALRKHGCRLAIAGASPMIRTALRRFRLDTSYEMADSYEQALAHAGGLTLSSAGVHGDVHASAGASAASAN